MDLLLILTYASICVVIFKVFKIPLTMNYVFPFH